MSDQPADLTLIMLRRLDEKLDRALFNLGEIKERIGLLEAQYASLSRRVDHIEGRLDRIERRLDIVPA